ncbi:MAG TPA: ribonuclease E/G [Phenylobacterium sp.]|jgi:Ribonuclease G/E|nr:ribonuclease E/G [Phenylobacterium sp.]
MSERRLFLDRSPGELRGVVTLDGRPERLIIRRDDDDPRLTLGARLVARVASVESALGSAFLDLGKGAQAILPYKPDARPVQGQALIVEIRNEPRLEKLAVARALGRAEGAPRLMEPPPEVESELRRAAPGMEIATGRAAREAADEAEAEALETVHPLPEGGSLAIEPTRALVAIDVDLGERKGADAKRVTRQANLTALGSAARLLRLKGLGGIVVIDLVGRGHDGQALLAVARAAFAPDNPGVAIGPVGRFGTMELSLPRRTRSVLEILQRPDGAPSDRALAQRLIRRLQAEAETDRGARLVGRCAPSVADAAAGLLPGLAQQLGARFSLRPDANFARERLEAGVE